MSGEDRSSVRLSELLAALSLGIDLGMGHPMEHVLRQRLLALRLAERLGLGAEDRQVVYCSSLLAWVGCHVDAYEQAKWFGDDLALKHDVRFVDEGRPLELVGFVLRHLGAGRSAVERGKLAVGMFGEGRRVIDDIEDNHWRTVDALMDRLGLDDTIRGSVAQTFERWDGKVGYDVDGAGLTRARHRASRQGLTNVTLEQVDAADLAVEEAFDVVFVFNSIHDQARPATVLQRIHDVLVPGGIFVMDEPTVSSRLEENIGNPMAPFTYAVSTLHCLTVSLAVGGAGLGTAWGQQLAVEMLSDAGFAEVAVHDAPGDPGNAVYVTRRTRP